MDRKQEPHATCGNSASFPAQAAQPRKAPWRKSTTGPHSASEVPVALHPVSNLLRPLANSACKTPSPVSPQPNACGCDHPLDVKNYKAELQRLKPPSFAQAYVVAKSHDPQRLSRSHRFCLVLLSLCGSRLQARHHRHRRKGALAPEVPKHCTIRRFASVNASSILGVRDREWPLPIRYPG